jgi:superfamily I DNA/RNA helicase
LVEIGIAVRTGQERRALSQWLGQEGVAVIDPANTALKAGAGVDLATMHGMKGLEYRCLAVVGMTEANMPHKSALTDESEDPLQHAYDVARERSLLFVASTRARDELRVSWTGKPSRFLQSLV